MPSIEDQQLRAKYRLKHRLDRRIAFLGDGNNPATVRVPGRSDYVYIQYPASDNNTSGLSWPTDVKMVINIDDSAGAAVLVGIDDEGDYAVVGPSTKARKVAGGSGLQGAQQHNINDWVDLNKSPLLYSSPYGTAKPLYIAVYGLPYVDNSRVYHDFRGISGGVNLSSYIPATAGYWCLAGLFLKTDDTVEVMASTPKAGGSTGDPIISDDVQECLDAATSTSIPISFWILRNGQTIIADTDKYVDGRQWINMVGGSGTGSSLPNFGSPTIITLASDVAAVGSARNIVLAAQTSTTDTLKELTGLSVGDEIVISADAGDTITIAHNDAGATVKILLYNETDLDLMGDQTMKLVLRDTNKLVQYVDEKGTGSGGSATIGAYGDVRPVSPAEGDLYFPTDGRFTEIYHNSTWQFADSGKISNKPSSYTWAWRNQSGASVVSNKGIEQLKTSTSAGSAQNLNIRKMAAPATPYTITARLQGTQSVGGSSLLSNWGLCFSESSSGKISIVGMEYSTGVFPYLLASDYTNFSTFSANNYAQKVIQYPEYFRLEDNGTNRKYSYSYDGVNFTEAYSVGRTSFMTADEVGFFINPYAIAAEISVSLMAWIQE